MNFDVNVSLKHFKGGELFEVRDVHNVMVENGRRWLSELVAYSYISPTTPASDIPQNIGRIRYLGLGMGSVRGQPSSFAPEFAAAYPPGFDPNATAGNVYQTADPTGPPISTLERPIRRTGTENPYASADPGDVWLYEDLVPSYPDNQSVTFRQDIDATGGELIYGSFTEMNISEAALLNDENSTDLNQPYSPVVSYVHFDTIVLSTSSIVALAWTIRFRS